MNQWICNRGIMAHRIYLLYVNRPKNLSTNYSNRTS